MQQKNLYVHLLITLLVILLGVSCNADDVTELAISPTEQTITALAPSTSVAPSVVAQPIFTTTSPILQATLAPTAVLTKTPVATDIPTSSAVTGWLTYQSDFYHYEISYPQDATVQLYGVSGFPTEELPEDMSATQYLSQLKQIYPEDICVTIAYQGGLVSIMAPTENGGKYGDCAGFGIGVYDVIEKSEPIIVDGVSYLANGFEIREQDEAATWQGEFLQLRLDDGTLITWSVSGDDVTFDEYLSLKEMLLQIIMSYRKN